MWLYSWNVSMIFLSFPLCDRLSETDVLASRTGTGSSTHVGAVYTQRTAQFAWFSSGWGNHLMYSISQEICTRFCCALLCCGMQSFIMNSHEVFIHIHQGCFAGTGAIVRLPQCQWSKPDGYGKISQCITTTKHSKAKTVCIFLGIYCMTTVPMLEIYRLRRNKICMFKTQSLLVTPGVLIKRIAPTVLYVM